MPNNEQCRKCGYPDTAIVSAPPPHSWQAICSKCGSWQKWVSKTEGDALGKTSAPGKAEDNRVALWLVVKSSVDVTPGEIRNLMNRSGLSAGDFLHMVQTSAIANGSQFGFTSALQGLITRN